MRRAGWDVTDTELLTINLGIVRVRGSCMEPHYMEGTLYGPPPPVWQGLSSLWFSMTNECCKISLKREFNCSPSCLTAEIFLQQQEEELFIPFCVRDIVFGHNYSTFWQLLKSINCLSIKLHFLWRDVIYVKYSKNSTVLKHFLFWVFLFDNPLTRRQFCDLQTQNKKIITPTPIHLTWAYIDQNI